MIIGLSQDPVAFRTETGGLPPDKPIAEANSVFLYRLLSGGYTTIRVTAFDVRLDRKSEGSTRIPIDDTVRVVIDKQWFWRRLVVHVAAHRTAAIGGLGRRPARAIEESVTHARNDLAAAREQAERVGPRLVERAEEAIRAFDRRTGSRHRDRRGHHLGPRRRRRRKDRRHHGQGGPPGSESGRKARRDLGPCVQQGCSETGSRSARQCGPTF